MRRLLRTILHAAAIWLLICSALSAAEAASPVDYAAVEAIFNKSCLDCHSSQEPEGKLVMETYEDLMKGGESGPSIIPGDSGKSLLTQLIEGAVEKDGKKRVMPPGKREKLSQEQIAQIRKWIDAGAPGPVGGILIARALNVPKIEPKVTPRRAIKAIAYASSSKFLAVARNADIEIISAETRSPIRTLAGHRGDVNDVVFSPDGKFLFAAAGVAGVFGEVRQWNVADGVLLRTMEGHRDAIYSLAISPNGQLLATGSYDQKIKLWNVESGKETRSLSGHNGAVFGLSFRMDGKILASASADRTVKLWDVATGDRRDTLAQSLKELYSVSFSPDGKRLVAGGVDNRIRVWQISENAAEITNPLLESRFAHEGAILKLAFSGDGKLLLSAADDRTVKIWDAAEIKEKLLLEKQSDWPQAVTFALDQKAVAVGSLDGTFQIYEAGSGKVMAPPKPQLVRLEPRGIQRGVATKVKLVGTALDSLTEVKFHHAKLKGEIVSGKSEPWISVTAASDIDPGTYEISVVNKNGESGKVQLHVDDLPQWIASGNTLAKPVPMPLSIWGTHEKSGSVEDYLFEAKEGQTLVFDAAAKRISSKADLVLTLIDDKDRVITSSNGMDGNSDPFLVQTFSKDGLYKIRVSELLLGASSNHFYRLTIGKLPYVVGYYPLSIPANRETEVELVGYNLPLGQNKLTVKAKEPGEIELLLDKGKYRKRKDFKLVVSDLTETREIEPNDSVPLATMVSVPGAAAGRMTEFSQSPDIDHFRFEAKAGQALIIETVAAQRGTPIDTKIEILHLDGKPVQRLQLQAVRNSAVTFRGIDSNTPDCRVENWEEMELNQYLYLQGEVVRLFRAPQGPDSGFLFYSLNGKRRTYFDTTPTSHANEEPCYIVEPHPAGARLVSSGLPVFPVNFENDDDGERKLGRDSKVHFTAPKDGTYVVRVTDTRGYGGDQFIYRLVVRPAKPDFQVAVRPANTTINAGSGQEFTVAVDRVDGFDGEVHVEIQNVPAGFSVSTPLIVQAGHTEAKGTLNAAIDAPPLSETNGVNLQVIATAKINGETVRKEVKNFGPIKLSDKPRLLVAMESERRPETSTGNGLLEITISPGETVPAVLKVQRNGHEDLVTFTVENLPHGIIVDNIGLNGVLLPKGENEREIFITAAKWVPETDRLCYAVENQAGRQTSRPVLVKVRNSQRGTTVTAR